ncbi:MAG: class I SAM-dependent methyltransferase [Solirubrobacteraceae bacterium]
MSESVREALDALREAVHRFPDQAGRGAALPRADTPQAFPFRFSVAGGTDPARRAELAARATALDPWKQGPFPLVENLVVGRTASDDLRWAELGQHIDTHLAGRRVLVVGSGAGYDAFAFAARGAEYVLACEPSDAFRQAEFLESIYKSGVDFQPLHWSALEPTCQGRFDIVHCDGLLHRVLDPMTLLSTLHRMTAQHGRLLVGSMMLADPERSELLRFVPDRHAGDPTWWFVPGRLAFRWLVETAGFDVEIEFGEREGPRDGFPVVTGYLRAAARALPID